MSQRHCPPRSQTSTTVSSTAYTTGGTDVAPQAEAIVDLDAYRANIATLASYAPGSTLMAVVKADAYGHGMAQCARAAREASANWIGVATIAEALSLRSGGDTGNVLCWLASPGADFASAIAADIEVTASSAEQLAEILAAGGRPRVQLKVDTGMHRIGCPPEDAPSLAVRADVVDFDRDRPGDSSRALTVGCNFRPVPELSLIHI